MMNDYTHTGKNQIARNYNEVTGTIEVNFSDELILETLQSNKNLLITTVIVLLEYVD